MHSALSYYRMSLADGERMSPKIPNYPFKIKHIQDLKFNDLPSQLKTKDTTFCEVMASPFYLKKKAFYNKKSPVVYPFWVPLTVSDKEGVCPPENPCRLPWFIREVLAPNENSRLAYPALGHVKKVDEVYALFERDRSHIEAYLKQSRSFFKKVNGKFWEKLEIEDWEIDDSQWVVIPPKASGMGINISRLYDYLSDQTKLPPLLKTILTVEPSKAEIISDIDECFAEIGHSGQMSGEFPLATSQRASIVGFSKLREGDILAVNGPPGTGKTTLLQSAFADTIVKSIFLPGKTLEPARILASSMNNQAITNVLDSCQISTSPGLFERWLPNLTSFGTYLTNKLKGEGLKNAEEKGYLSISRGANRQPFRGWYFDYIKGHSPEECMAYFTSHFQSYFGEEDLSADKMLVCLKKELEKRQQTIEIYLGVARKIKEFDVEDNLENAIEEERIRLEQETAGLKERIGKETLILRKVEDLLAEKNILKKALSLLPFAKQEREEKLAAFLQGSELPEGISAEPLCTFPSRLKALIKNREAPLRTSERRLEQIGQVLETYQGIDKAWQALKEKSGEEKAKVLQGIWDEARIGERINILCDLELRHESLWLAVHFWELKWLVERDDLAVENLEKDIESQKTFYQTLSYLTPFFVSTFHSAPGFCSCIEKDPSDNRFISGCLTRFFDLLVVDEGGQISPEVAVPTFALAKKALVVGDVKQIEPVWNITSSHIDKGNMQLSGLVEDSEIYEDIKQKGLTCFSGSILKVAQNKSMMHYPESCDEKGTMLQEHRRCVDEIIQYSNQEIYRGLLIPKVGSLDTVLERKRKQGKPCLNFPALGYLNVPGESSRYQGSLQNQNEARAIAAWIKKYEKELKAYGDLEKTIGIVTPFRAQKNLITRSLKDVGIITDDENRNLTIGTVHALQGAERPVILFSPVYGSNDFGGNFFFDVNFNMLNVALSRAKEHFLVLGTMKNFDSWASTPSGKLGQYLFADSGNELAGDFLFDGESPETGILHKTPGVKVERINDLDRHNRSLQAAISGINGKTKERLIIVSPFISSHAIRDGDLIPHFNEARRKNIKITVYTDAFLDRRNGELKPSAKEGRQILEDCGVKVVEKKGVHSKSMAIDSRVLLEGSFNWLSAVRDKNSPYYRHEVTMVYNGEGTEKLIADLVEELEALKS